MRLSHTYSELHLLQLPNLYHAKRLLKNLVNDQLILESVYYFAKSLVLLAFLEYGFLLRLNDFFFTLYFFLKMYDITLELDDPSLSLRYIFFELTDLSF